MKSLSCVLLLSLAFALSLSCVLLPALAATPSGDDAPVPKSSIARAEIMICPDSPLSHMPHVASFLSNLALGAASYARVTLRCDSDSAIPASLQVPEILFLDAANQVLEYVELEAHMKPHTLHKLLHDRGFLTRRGRPASAGSNSSSPAGRARSPQQEREARELEAHHAARAEAESKENDRMHAMHILAASQGVAHGHGHGHGHGHDTLQAQAPPKPNAHRARIFSENLRRPAAEQLTEAEIDVAAAIAAAEERLGGGGFIPRDVPESELLGRAALGAGGAYSAVHMTHQRGDLAATAALGMGLRGGAAAMADPISSSSEARAVPPEYMPGFAPPIGVDGRAAPNMGMGEPGMPGGMGMDAGAAEAEAAPRYDFVQHTEL